MGSGAAEINGKLVKRTLVFALVPSAMDTRPRIRERQGGGVIKSAFLLGIPPLRHFGWQHTEAFFLENQETPASAHVWIRETGGMHAHGN